MLRVLTAEQMREVDRLTTEKYGIPPIILMENAAHAVVREIAEQLGGSVEDKSILVLCGPGNNGGDGAAIARILWTMGAFVEVVLLGRVEATKGDARTNFEILQRISDNEDFEVDQPDLAFEEIIGIDEWLDYDSANFHADDPDIIVDALFGTGVTRPLDGVFEQVVAFIDAYCEVDEDCGTRVISVDLPSGLNADRSDCIGAATRAHTTVTFTAPKPANVLPPALACNGKLIVANIGSPCDLVSASASELYVADESDVLRWFEATRFTRSSFKNRRGHLLVVAGSSNYTGAAVLCGNAAIRSGVGLVTLAVPQSSRDSIIARVAPEIMVRGVIETEDGSAGSGAAKPIREILKKADALAIGCGLSLEDETRHLVGELVAVRSTPIVIDADALTALSPFALEGSDELPLILTPHEGEFLRLLGTEDRSVIDDRVSAVREFATKHKVILVLKGERVLIGGPDGRVVVIPRGNSGVGKAGNGDTLTGIIAGFVGQSVQCKVDLFESVVAAVYVAAAAGDLAESKLGKRVMTASDVQACLGEIFASFEARR